MGIDVDIPDETSMESQHTQATDENADLSAECDQDTPLSVEEAVAVDARSFTR